MVYSSISHIAAAAYEDKEANSLLTIDYEEQLSLAKQGNMQAFEILIQQYERLVYSVAFKMMNNREDARDLAQEALIRIYKSMDKCDNITAFKNWACRITTNVCIDELRRRKNRQTVPIDVGTGDESFSILENYAAPNPTPEEAVLQRERTQELSGAINKLSETHKALIILRDIKGLSYEEVAEALGMNLGTVKSGISRARIRLREFLSVR